MLAVLLVSCLFMDSCSKYPVSLIDPKANQKYQIRVLLQNDINSCTVSSTSPCKIISNKKTLLSLEADQQLKISVSSGKLIVNKQTCDRDITIAPQSPYIFSINDSAFRGELRLIANKDGKTFDAVNTVPLEPYLAGVIGEEMPIYWKKSALQAQTIAARTYCLYIKKKFGPNRHWDLKKTQANQVYGGISAESWRIWQAVTETSGKVLVCKQNEKYDIFPAYYSSACGGYTESSKPVFGDNFKTLKAVDCPYCIKTAKKSFFRWDNIEFDKKQVSEKLHAKYSKLEQIGDINNISIIRTSKHKGITRALMIELTGSNGKTDVVRAEDFRLTIDPTGMKLKSTVFDMRSEKDKWIFTNGRGFGHGVGMCQYGAQAMAKKSKSAEQILFHYYQNSKIINIYKND